MGVAGHGSVWRAASAVLLVLLVAFFPWAAAPTSAYTLHASIRIASNADFTASNGVTGGSGTPSDPYVISGWEIGTSYSGAIAITGTDAYFVIRDVRVYDSQPPFFPMLGIQLSGVTHGRVENASLSTEARAISVVDSSDVVLDGNNLSLAGPANLGMTPGIEIRDSRVVTVTGNLIENRRDDGILVLFSDRVEVTANVIAGNARYGLHSWKSTNLTISANAFDADDIFLEGDAVEHYSSHRITADNLVAGLPIRYEKDCAGLEVIGEPLGELIVANCSSVRVEGLAIQGTDVAIEFGFVTNASIACSTFRSNAREAIQIHHSVSIDVAGNTFEGNLQGLWIENSREVTAEGNQVLTQEVYGISVWTSSDVRIARNEVRDTGHSIFAWTSTNVTIEDNRVVGARGLNSGAVEFEFDSSGTIQGNWIEGSNERGVEVDYSEATIRDNVILGSNQTGIAVVTSPAGTAVIVQGNRVVDNEDGIWVYSAHDVLIRDNEVSANVGRGIWLQDSDAVAAHDNRLLGNSMQAEDNRGLENAWDDGYPGGGNYWSDYAGVDNCSGPSQNVCPDPDGIGDTPFILDADSRDRYPLMGPPTPANASPAALLQVLPKPAAPGVQALVTANGSFDADGTIVTFNFTFGDGTWTGDIPASYAFHTWTAPGTYSASVTVTDDRGAHDTAETPVCISGPEEDSPPVAVGQVTPGNPGTLDTTFVFDGTGSFDAEEAIVAYRWEFGDGMIATTATASHRYAARGVFSATLTVWDTSGKDGRASLAIEVANRPPVAYAGPDQAVVAGSPVQLAGTGTDAEGDALTFAWTQIGGPSVTLVGADRATPSFTPDTAGTYEFSLTVADGFGGTASDIVTIVVQAQHASGGVNSLSPPAWWLLALAVVPCLLVFVAWRRRRKKSPS